MAYEKQTWNTGDIITAEKLNHMEDGINGNTDSASGLVLHITQVGNTEMRLDKTYSEILSAMLSGTYVVLVAGNGAEIVEVHPIVSIGNGTGSNKVIFDTSSGSLAFSATSSDDYPTYNNLTE